MRAGNTFGKRQFKCPYGVAVDRQSGNVLVADSESHQVFEFSGANGNFVRYTLTASADGCHRPCGLAVGPDCGTLVVTESSDPEDRRANVQAYRLHEGTPGGADFEQVWGFRTESAV